MGLEVSDVVVASVDCAVPADRLGDGHGGEQGSMRHGGKQEGAAGRLALPGLHGRGGGCTTAFGLRTYRACSSRHSDTGNIRQTRDNRSACLGQSAIESASQVVLRRNATPEKVSLKFVQFSQQAIAGSCAARVATGHIQRVANNLDLRGQLAGAAVVWAKGAHDPFSV